MSTRISILFSCRRCYPFVILLVFGAFWILMPLSADYGFAQQPVLKSVTFPSPVVAVASDAKSHAIFAASGNIISKFDSELNCLAQQQSEMEFIHDFALTQNQLVVAGGDPGVNGGIEVYSREALTLSRHQEIHTDSIQALAVQGNSIFTASADHECRRVGLDRLDTLLRFKEHSKRVTCLTLIPDADLAVSAGLDDTIRVWEFEGGTLKRTLTHHQDDVLDIDAQQVETVPLPMLVSVSKDHTVRFWQPTIGRMLRFKRLQQIPTVCVWVNGTRNVVIATAGGQVIEIDSVNLTIRELADLKKPIYSLAIISNQQIAIGTQDSLDLISTLRNRTGMPD